MPGTTIPRGNVGATFLISANLTPVSVNTIVVAEQSFTVPGLQVGDFVKVSWNTAPTAGVGIVNARVSAANTLTLAFVNPTIGAVVPVAGAYVIEVARPEFLPLPANGA